MLWVAHPCPLDTHRHTLLLQAPRPLLRPPSRPTQDLSGPHTASEAPLSRCGFQSGTPCLPLSHRSLGPGLALTPPATTQPGSPHQARALGGPELSSAGTVPTGGKHHMHLTRLAGRGTPPRPGPPTHLVVGFRSHMIQWDARQQGPRHGQPFASPQGQLPWTL